MEPVLCGKGAVDIERDRCFASAPKSAFSRFIAMVIMGVPLCGAIETFSLYLAMLTVGFDDAPPSTGGVLQNQRRRNHTYTFITSLLFFDL